MIKHTRTLGAIGAALLSAIAAAGCTNYIGAHEPTPQILGVMIQDINDNESASPGFCPVTGETCGAKGDDCSGHCSTATLETCLVDADCGGSCSSTTSWGCATAGDCPGFCSVDTTRGCNIDDDCAPGETCDTTTGQTCDLTAQTCVGAHGHCGVSTTTACLADGDCGHCSATTTLSCTTDSTCPAGETCVPQTCVLPGTCSTTTATACAVNSQCPAGETCDNATAPGGLLTCDYAPTGSPYDWPYPPRTGPMFVAGYTGGAVTSPATWSLGADAPLASGVPSGPWPSPKNGPFLFAKPRIIFNKLLDGPSIQPDPASCDPTGNFTVTATPGGDVTANFGVCYDPSSPTPAYGAAVILVPASGRLRSATTYSIVGTVKDKQNRDTAVDYTIVTAP